MEGLNGFSAIFLALFHVIEPFAALAIVALGYWAVAELQRHGYRATYAAALVRAMGAGVLAAQDKGLDPFSGPGRQLVLQTGTAYLRQTVGESAEALGITTATEHQERIAAQLGVVAAQAQATAEVTSVNAPHV